MNKEQFWRIVDDVRSSADPRDTVCTPRAASTIALEGDYGLA